MAIVSFKRSLAAAAVAVLLSACQSAALPAGDGAALNPEAIQRAVMARKVAPAEHARLHFDADGQYHASAQAGGYYREVLGKAADGGWVAQDFYQDSGTKQTDPFVIFHPEGLRNFDNDVIDSAVVWYRPDGSLMQSANYRRGVLEGWVNYYDPQGRRRLGERFEQGEMKQAQSFNEQGRLVMENDYAEPRARYWHANGKLALEFVGGDMPKGWDEQGRELNQGQTMLLMHYLDSLMYKEDTE